MCRDKGYTPTKRQHIERFKLDDKDYYAANYNQIAGTVGLPIVTFDGVEGKNTSVDALWGVIPFWSKDYKDAMKNANGMVNAKAHELEEKKTYKPLFERGQRCLIPCSYYFEHHWLNPDDPKTKKIPYVLKKRDDEIFTTPGLYSTWTDKESGEMILSYTMLTTFANSLMKQIHNGGEHPGRMPLVIERDMEAIWLKPDSSYNELKEVMEYKIPSSHLIHWPVRSIRSKNARTGPDVLEEWTEYSHLIK